MYPYKKIKLSSGKTRDEHRIIMENHIGRTLSRNEVVHHKDGNKRNNNISNLELMSLSDHSRLHNINADTGWKSSREVYISSSIINTNTTGYVGVREKVDNRNPKKRKVRICAYSPSFDGSVKIIGYFKDFVTAAHYRDSATRFYKVDGFVLNFPESELLPGMSIDALKIIKKLNNH